MLLKFANRVSSKLFLILSIFSLFIPKNRKLILFGAFDGKHYGDNSGSLYLYCLEYHKDEFRCVWLTDNVDVISYIRGIGGEAYLKKSLTGIWLSLRASLVVICYKIEDVLFYKPISRKTIILHLHHGIAVRKGHLESKKSATKGDLEFAYYKKCVSYMVATSLWAADRQRMIISVPPSRTAITGYPRNDVWFNSDKAMINSLSSKYDLGKYTVLYATSWRKWRPIHYFPFDDLDMNELYCFLKERNMTIIIRPHRTDFKRQNKDMFWKIMNDLNEVVKVVTQDDLVDVQPLLYLSDCLITDYSSIQYDFLLLNRPIIYLTYDIGDYIKKVGLNKDFNNLAVGPKPITQAEFLSSLEMFYNNKDPFYEERLQARDVVHKYKDGQSCRRVYELIKEMTAPV